MNVLFRQALSLLCALISLNCISQTTLTRTNSVELIDAGTDLYNKEKYKEAIQVYKKVPKSDTNYHLAIYNISLAHYNDSNYLDSKQSAEEGLKYYPEKDHEWLNLIANNYDRLGQTKEAIATYDKIISKYNNHYLAWYNKGVAYYNIKDYEEAKKCFQRSLLINPYYSYSHHFLGSCAYNQGNLVGAMLSYLTGLAINPENKFASNSISMLNAISKVGDEVVSKAGNMKNWSADNFEMQQEIIISKVSYDKQYKLKASLEDVIVRQVQVLFEKLEYNKADKGFWNQYYVPFYMKLYKDEQFEPFMFYIFRSVDIKEIKSYVKNNKKKIDALIPSATAYFNEIRETQTLDLASRKELQSKYVFVDNILKGKGKVMGEGNKSALVGPWEFYYQSGVLKSKGSFNDKEEKTGEWLFYHENGQLKEKAGLKDDKAEGKSLTYFDNGQLSIDAHYLNGELNGEYKEYFYNGALLKTGNYKDGNRQGTFKSYTSAGTLSNVINYKDDKEEGMQTYYHKNGNKSTVSFYKDGQLSGNYKEYFMDGTLKGEGDFANNKRNGTFKNYYNNGKVKSVVSYAVGEPEGDFKEFYQNGAEMVKGTYVKGKLDGKYEDLDRDGKLYSESLYEKGRLKELKFINKEGKVISNVSTRTGAANLSYYDGFGNKTSEGYFTKDGERDGKTTYYYRNGKVSGISNYKKGMLHGEKINYYSNGNISEKTTYKDDVEDGYRITYYPDGKVKHEGAVVDGRYEGLHLSYDNFGGVTTKMSYKDGDQEGYVEYFHSNGKLDMDQKVSYGWLMGFREYDTTGNITNEVNLLNGKGAFEIKNYAGGKYVKGNYDNTFLNGERRTFFPDGSTSLVEFYKHGINDSLIKKYYYGGQVEYEGNYKMDERNGKWNFYHDNGKLYYSEVYTNGRVNGITTLFNDDGSIDKEITYKENQLDGEYKFYGDNNQLAVILNYEVNRLISYTYEDKSGKVLPFIPVKNGVGNVLAYYKNGTKSVDFNFEEDEGNGSRKIFFTNGKAYIEGTRLLGNEHGNKKIYYVNGQVNKDENYYYGNLHGLRKRFYENGKLMEEENWYNGQQHGISKYYDNNGQLKQTRTYYYGAMQTVK